MLDFSFIAPTVLSLCPSLLFSLSLYICLSHHTHKWEALWGPTVFSPGMSASICHPWVWGTGHGVGAYRSSLPVIDVAYSSVLLCLYSPRLSIHIRQEMTHYTQTHNTSGHVQTPSRFLFLMHTHTHTNHMRIPKTIIINMNNSLMLECFCSCKVPPLASF